MMVLPVIVKAKIGMRLAYPIRWESLHPLFEGLPQAAKSTLSFYDRPVYWASQFNKILANGDPYEILVCHIQSEGHTLAGIHKYQNISWQVQVYPVLREHKAVAAEALQTQALPALREFLLKTYLNDGNHGNNRPYHFVVRFFPDESRIEFFPYNQRK